MQQTTGTRELFVLEHAGGRIRGTFHRPRGDASSFCEGAGGWSRPGILFFSGMPSTRAARGDTGVFWAESMAELGYPSFRVDLPGFGDSDGAPPADWVRFIDQGGYAAVGAEIVEQLARRFGLARVVMVGHCAGAVSAIYTAAENRRCSGLVLIDPYFYAAETERPRLRQQLSFWGDQSLLGGMARQVFGWLKWSYLKICPNAYPDNANIPLLCRWRDIASRGVPVLILRAAGPETSIPKRRAAGFDYFEYVKGLAGRKGKVVSRSIAGANHTFSNQVGRTAVCDLAGEWLANHFPGSGEIKLPEKYAGSGESPMPFEVAGIL